MTVNYLSKNKINGRIVVEFIAKMTKKYILPAELQPKMYSQQLIKM